MRTLWGLARERSGSHRRRLSSRTTLKLDTGLPAYSPRFLLVEARDDEARRAIEAVPGARYELAERLSPSDLLYRPAG